MKPEVAFGRVLKKLRTDQGLSQENLALEAGLERTFISMMERGLRQPSLTTILKIAAVLNIPASDIVAEVEKLLSAKRR